MNNELNLEFMEYFKEVKLTEDYNPYFCSVEEAISIVIIGTFCGFQNLKQIHQWADHEKIKIQLAELFGIKTIPCYYWLTRLLKIIDPKSLNECFIRWIYSIVDGKLEGETISFDGKSIRSTSKMDCYDATLHIVSAQISGLGLTFGQDAVLDKSNEIPATQRLIKMLKLNGCVVVADALNCQKETANAIINQGGDYLLCPKDNHKTLKKDIEDFVQDPDLIKTMDKFITKEKNRDRVEKRTAFVCNDIDWLTKDHKWNSLKCIGAIYTEFESKSETSSNWHYYISSKTLSAEELLKHARAEWSVESMHWLLDVHFREDYCRILDENLQKNMNMFRKIVINLLRSYKTKTNSNKPFSNIMLDCLIDQSLILDICSCFEN